jgi:hypothetical protein
MVNREAMPLVWAPLLNERKPIAKDKTESTQAPNAAMRTSTHEFDPLIPKAIQSKPAAKK